MIHLENTTKSVETAVEDLTAAVEKHEFGVLHIHDLQATMKNKGVDFPHACQVMEVCNPHHAAAILAEDIRVSLALPCRITVYEENGQTRVGTLLPSELMGVFGDGPAMAAVAREVENSLLAIIAEAL